MNPRDSEIVRLAKSGMPPRDIRRAMTLGPCTIHTIYEVLSRARRGGESIPNFSGGGRPLKNGSPLRHVEVPTEVYDRFLREASVRKATPTSLIRDLLTTIADDNLFGALLDG